MSWLSQNYNLIFHKFGFEATNSDFVDICAQICHVLLVYATPHILTMQICLDTTNFKRAKWLNYPLNRTQETAFL
jgi:hypothetical protein